MPLDDSVITNQIATFRRQSWRDKKSWDRRTKDNWAAFWNQQDWSHKAPGQSTEFIPRVSRSTQRTARTIKSALVSTAEWFSAEDKTGVLQPKTLEAILGCYLSHLIDDSEDLFDFSVFVEDSVTAGQLSSLMVAKVGGRVKRELDFAAEPAEAIFGPDDMPFEFEGGNVLTFQEEDVWYLAVDLINPRYYYPDPTGRNRFKIHRVFRDLDQVKAKTKTSSNPNGIYDEGLVATLESHFQDREAEEDTGREQGKDHIEPQTNRHQVVLDEYWGTLFNLDGSVAKDGETELSNIVTTVADEKFLIRKPTENPNWHREDPFVTAPLLRVPWSVWHKAFMDDATPINRSMNEMISLIYDGGVREALGVTEFDPDAMFDPGQASAGIQPGDSIARKPGLPASQQVVRHEELGKVPGGSIQVFGLLDREYEQATMSNDLSTGGLPGKEVLATEVADARNEISSFFGGIAQGIEVDYIVKILVKGLKTIWQHVDSFDTPELRGKILASDLAILEEMSPEERFAAFSKHCGIKVQGFSGKIAKSRTLQRALFILQLIGRRDSMLGQIFAQKYSVPKLFDVILRNLDFDPKDIELTEDEVKGGNNQQEIAERFMSALERGGGDRQAGNGKGADQSDNVEGGSPFIANQDFAVAGGAQN